MRLRSVLSAVLTVLACFSALAQPVPKITLPQPQGDALIGDTFKFCVLFENDQGTPGFAPFLDLRLDQHGADGPLPCDGVTYVSAELVGITPPVPLTPVVAPVTLPPCGNGSSDHPFETGTPGWLPMAHPPGSQLVTLALPFGSFDSSQPQLRVEVTVKIHSHADNGHPLSVDVRGGFRYGDDPLNVTGNQPVISAWSTETITPHVLLLTKRFLGAEDEIVPGPNFAEDYEIDVNVAPGHTINGLVLSDCTNNTDVTFTSVTTSGTQTIGPPNCFKVNYLTLTGPASGPADTITAHFFVNNTPGLSPNCSAPVDNQISATAGSWTPLDTRDAPVNPVTATASKTIDKKAIAILKTAQIVGGGPPIPPAVVQYTVTFRISDFQSFNNLVITDTLSDGLVFVPNSATYSVTSQGNTVSGALPGVVTPAPGLNSYLCPPDPNAPPCDVSPMPGPVSLAGGTKVTFNLGFLGTVTGGGSGGAVGTVVFKANIVPNFSFGPHSKFDKDKALDKHDPLLNHVEIAGKMLLKGGSVNCGDSSNVCLAVPGDTFVKEVVGWNGSYLSPIPGPIAVPLPQFSRDDTITYRLTKVIPSGNAEDLSVRDWFARPVLIVPPTLPVLVPVCGAQPPAVNSVCYTAVGPVPQPTVLTDPVTNSISFGFGNLNNPPNTPVTITLEITLQVTRDPFADGLFLTNEAQECERNSYGTQFCQVAIAQFELTEPALRIHKGILCPTGTCPLLPPVEHRRLSGVSATPICTPGAPCPRFTGTVNSNNVAGFVGTTTSPADAGDTVTFAIVVENLGHGPFGAYDIALNDVLPAGMSLVAGTVCINRGDGVALQSSTPFPSLSLVDGVNGALSAYSPVSGQNIAVITFDAVIGPPAQVQIGSCLTNTAELTSYSNIEGGANFVTAGFTPPFTAEARVCITPKEIEKTIIRSSEPHTTNSPAKLAIGEIVRYSLRVHVPEGTANSFQIIDNLPADLQFIGTATVQTTGVDNSLTFTGTPATPASTSPLTFDFGTLTNHDTDADCEYVIVYFNALVLNSANNNNGNTKDNSFTVVVNGVGIATSPVVTATIVEPLLTITKTVTVTGPLAFYTVTVTNVAPSTTTAFDVAITDVIGPCLKWLKVLGATSSGGASVPVTTGTLVKVARIPLGGSVVVKYKAWIICRRCEHANNTATVRWTSLPGTGTPAGPQNQTGNITPGASGAFNGERDGSGGLNGVDDYAATASASICGRVCGIKFADPNGNGIQDTGEPPLNGWTITATDANGNVVATTVTANGGKYCLDLPPGTYQICETPQPKWVQTFPSTACHPVTITPGATISPRNFGNKECWGRVCGIKRGQDKPGTPDVPLAGWTIVAYPTGGGAPIFTVTDAAGKYCLDLPGPGGYTITEIQQTGWSMIAPAQPYQVFVECVPSPTGTPGTAVVQNNAGTPNALDFRNVNLCAGKQCPAPGQCEVHDGQPVCATPPAQSLCALVKCGFGTHCVIINGDPVCVP